jgi:uncharacterized protein
MFKLSHEFRDPIHMFIKMSPDERAVVDSRPVQRLRYIRQLATTYLVYPGATHTRFEHSLGVMELASKIFDVITDQNHIVPEVLEIIRELNVPDDLQYWRHVLRMAALCHDIGHSPFSHAADLLESSLKHEHLTKKLILSEEMKPLWDNLRLRAADVAKIAVGNEIYTENELTTWETILSEIITGDIFGADRIDYLLRDSHYCGVAYGKFDHYRLIDTLRILTPPPSNSGAQSKKYSIEPTLGIESGGLLSAESLLLARYFMFSQVYYHHIRRIYDIHLKDFIVSHFGKLPVDLNEHLKLTDSEVLAALHTANLDHADKDHDLAVRFCTRTHFKLLYQRNPIDSGRNPEAVKAISEKAIEKFGEENVRYDPGRKKKKYDDNSGGNDFPVLQSESSSHKIYSSLSLSSVLLRIPEIACQFTFLNRNLLSQAETWLKANKDAIIRIKEEE